MRARQTDRLTRESYLHFYDISKEVMISDHKPNKIVRNNRNLMNHSDNLPRTVKNPLYSKSKNSITPMSYLIGISTYYIPVTRTELGFPSDTTSHWGSPKISLIFQKTKSPNQFVQARITDPRPILGSPGHLLLKYVMVY